MLRVDVCTPEAKCSMAAMRNTMHYLHQLKADVDGLDGISQQVRGGNQVADQSKVTWDSCV